MRRVLQVQVSTPLFAGGLWLLSISLFATAFAALPTGLLMPTPFGWYQILGVIVIASVALQASHQVAPIALAWGNGEFRRVMLVRWRKFLLLPAVLVTAAIALPLLWVAPVYLVWNAYHYGMQNFGVLSLCWRQQWRKMAMVFCLAVTTVPMVLMSVPTLVKSIPALLMIAPTLLVHHPLWAWLFVFEWTVSWNHWIVDIGLSGRASLRGWLFVGAILVAGLIGFIWYEPTAHGFHRRSDQLLQVAMALGFVHFLYSRFVWRLSDPQVRATIGVNLLIKNV